MNNKILQDSHLEYQLRWARKPFGLSRVQPILVYPAILRYMSILCLNILTLLAHTQSADNMFHWFTVLRENENCLISSLHCFFANVCPCPLFLLSQVIEKICFHSLLQFHTALIRHLIYRWWPKIQLYLSYEGQYLLPIHLVHLRCLLCSLH